MLETNKYTLKSQKYCTSVGSGLTISKVEEMRMQNTTLIQETNRNCMYDSRNLNILQKM